MELDQVEWWKEEEIGGEQKNNISRRKRVWERERKKERERERKREKQRERERDRESLQ